MSKEKNDDFCKTQELMSADIYECKPRNSHTDWLRAALISEDVALSIYQRNLHMGVVMHLQSHFPQAHAYIGVLGFRFICRELLVNSPPSEPLFTVYAAHFPAFLMEYGASHSTQAIWPVLAQLAHIDFFHQNASCENQCIEVADAIYALWLALREVCEHHTEATEQGLYQTADYHPEQIEQNSNQVTLTTFMEGDTLYFRNEKARQ